MQAAGGSISGRSARHERGILALFLRTGRSDAQKLRGLAGTQELGSLICWPQGQGHIIRPWAHSPWHTRHTPPWGRLSIRSHRSLFIWVNRTFPNSALSLDLRAAGCPPRKTGDFLPICTLSRQNIRSRRVLLRTLPEGPFSV